MGSRKGSAKAKRIAEFKAGLGGMDDVFAREDARKSKKAAEKDAALRRKACESKNRYSCKSDAEAAIIACAEHGTTGLPFLSNRFRKRINLFILQNISKQNKYY